MKHVFIIGSRGIPVGYSGYETFVLKLTEYSRDMNDIKYHVACRGKGDEKKQYNNAERFFISLPPIGAAKAVIYDLFAYNKALTTIKKKSYVNAWIYILACRIGPFMRVLVKKAKKLGVNVAINPDGHEWMRGKWKPWIRKYWKYSEKLMVKYSDLIVCDAKEMERYIKAEYEKYEPKTVYLPYGADENIEFCNDDRINDWYRKVGIKEKEYYLIVGRFIPENNYEFMIREFMKSNSLKSLVLITDVKSNSFYQHLKEATSFQNDKRIKFVGTVFDRPLINRIRNQSFIYLHGHEVGGTNPSLLEAMACKCVICAIDVIFSREVLGKNGIYFKKEPDNLKGIIEKIERERELDLMEIRNKNCQNVKQRYKWERIADEYKILWNG